MIWSVQPADGGGAAAAGGGDGGGGERGMSVACWCCQKKFWKTFVILMCWKPLLSIT